MCAYKIRFARLPQFVDNSAAALQPLFTPANVGGSGAIIKNVESLPTETSIEFADAYVPNPAQKTAIKETIRNNLLNRVEELDTATLMDKPGKSKNTTTTSRRKRSAK